MIYYYQRASERGHGSDKQAPVRHWDPKQASCVQTSALAPDHV